MNIKMTENDLHYIMMFYLINISETISEMDNGTSNSANVVYNKEFDKFLKVLDRKSLGGLRTMFGRLPPDVKLKYRLFMKAIQDNKKNGRDMRFIA